MILHAYVDVYVLCVCIVGHGYTTDQHCNNPFFFVYKFSETISFYIGTLAGLCRKNIVQ